MPGRFTGNARHLTDPVNKIYYGTMEEGFYEVYVNSLAVKELYQDGNFVKQRNNGVSEDKKAAVWAGSIDDLWQMGKPVGYGGPWLNTPVKAGVASDPYLISHYDRKELSISHQGSSTVNFILEVDATGNGDFMEYMRVDVAPGKTFNYSFPSTFHGRWIRLKANANVVATTCLDYK